MTTESLPEKTIVLAIKARNKLLHLKLKPMNINSRCCNWDAETIEHISTSAYLHSRVKYSKHKSVLQEIFGLQVDIERLRNLFSESTKLSN